VIFVSWNLQGTRPLLHQARLLSALRWDVCALQEVRPDALDQLRQGLGLSDGGSMASGAELASDADEDQATPFFSALAVRHPYRLADVTRLSDAPSPRRTLVARVGGGGAEFRAASLALPPGVSWGMKKSEQADAIVGWITAGELPVVIGIDANTPKVDHPDPRRMGWWDEDGAGARALLGPDATHGARDVYRDHVAATPALLRDIERDRPDGPLATSYRSGSNERRYDHILATRTFEVDYACYVYDAALAAGSDHGLALARLT
jgi:endonuclease/exonuclease/phosphatase family metal-dependent hydrolase